jgi:hypothetical protein
VNVLAGRGMQFMNRDHIFGANWWERNVCGKLGPGDQAHLTDRLLLSYTWLSIWIRTDLRTHFLFLEWYMVY